MPYTLRRTWPDTDREDFVIKCERLDMGRVYLTQLPNGDRFVWSIYINGHVLVVPGVAISGQAVTLSEAAAAFKQSYGRMREKAGLPKRSGDNKRAPARKITGAL
jgi:hypothetical protein